MAVNQFHILMENGDYILTENGVSHVLLEAAASLEHDVPGAGGQAFIRRRRRR